METHWSDDEEPLDSIQLPEHDPDECFNLFPDVDPALFPAPHVFISHTGAQKAGVVHSMLKQFKEEYPELYVFVDEWKLEPGDPPPPKMAAALRSTAVGVLVISKEFVRKKYPMDELRILLGRAQRAAQQRKQQVAQQQRQGVVATVPTEQLQLVPIIYNMHVGGLMTAAIRALSRCCHWIRAALSLDRTKWCWLVDPVSKQLVFDDLETEETVMSLYKTKEWCVKDAPVREYVLEHWAKYLVALTSSTTCIRPNQYKDDAKLIQIVLERVVGQLRNAKKLPAAIARRSKTFVNKVPPPPSVTLIGRENELQQALAAVLLQEHRYVQVLAAPGEGKSTLVQHLVDAVCLEWLGATEGQLAYMLELDMQRLAGAGDLRQAMAVQLLDTVLDAGAQQRGQAAQKDAAVQQLLSWLAKKPKVLIVLENVEHALSEKPKIDQLKEMLQELHAVVGTHLVVATRHKAPLVKGVAREQCMVELHTLSTREGLQVVEAHLANAQGQEEGRTKYIWRADVSEKEAAKQVVELVGQNPLALSIAAGLVNEGELAWQEVLAKTREGLAKVEPQSQLGGGGMSRPVSAVATWLQAFLSQEEQQLLSALAVFRGSFTAAGAAAVAGRDLAWTAERLQQCSRLLVQRREVRGIASTNSYAASEVRYSLHALVRAAGVQLLDTAAGQRGPEVLRWQRSFVAWMFGSSSTSASTGSVAAAGGPGHGVASATHATESSPDVDSRAAAGLRSPGDALPRCAPDGVQPDPLHCRHLLREEVLNYDAAAPWIGAGVVEALDNGAAEQACRLLAKAQVVAAVLAKSGHCGVALSILGTVRWLLERACGADSEAAMLVRNSEGVTLSMMGKMEQAHRVLLHVLEARVRVLGDGHPSTTATRTSLAAVLYHMGKVEDAHKVAGEALERTMVDPRQQGQGWEALGWQDALVVKSNAALASWEVGERTAALRLIQEVVAAQGRQEVVAAQGRQEVVHQQVLLDRNNEAALLFKTGQHVEALAKARALAELACAVLGEEDCTTLVLRSNLAQIMAESGQLEEAVQLQCQVLVDSIRVAGPQHPITLLNKQNLALSLSNDGQLASAKVLQQEVLEAREQVFGAEHPVTLICKGNLAATLRLMGELGPARVALEEVLQVQARVLGAGHLDMLPTQNLLAVTMYNMGDLPKARELLEEAVVGYENADGIERHHPDLLGARQNLVEVLRSMGDLLGARREGQALLEVQQQVLGPEHPTTLTTMNNLAVTMHQLQELQQAQELLEKTLAGRMRCLGPEHCDTLMVRNSLAALQRDRGQLVAAVAQQLEVLDACRRVLGRQHPQTLFTEVSLAKTLMRKGDFEQAKFWLEEALEVQQARDKKVGLLNPATLDTMHALGDTLYAMGLLEDAKQQQEKVLEGRTWVLGTQHPSTLAAALSLEITVQGLGLRAQP